MDNGPEGDSVASAVAALGDVPTSILADVSEGEVVMDHQIGSITGVATVGRALTVRVPPGDNLTVHEAVTRANPGDVLVVDGREYVEAAQWGELLSTSARAHDLAGTVIDGAVRDVEAVTEMGYPVFARAVTPKSPTKATAGPINVPITCGGVQVKPGDIIVADRDGVAAIDPDRTEELLAAAEDKLDREATLRQKAQAGDYLYDVLDLGARGDGDGGQTGEPSHQHPPEDSTPENPQSDDTGGQDN